MAAHVTKGAGAVIETLAPLAGVVVAIYKIVLRGYAAPGVPIQACGYLVFFVGSGVRVAPLLAAPSVDLGDFSNCALMNEFHSLAVSLARVDLDTHLSDQFIGCGKFTKLAALEHIMGERFLHVYMLA